MPHREAAGDDAGRRQRHGVAIAGIGLEAALRERHVEIGVEPGEDLPAPFQVQAVPAGGAAGLGAACVAAPHQLALEVQPPDRGSEIDAALQEPRPGADLVAERARERPAAARLDHATRVVGMEAGAEVEVQVELLHRRHHQARFGRDDAPLHGRRQRIGMVRVDPLPGLA